MSVTIPKVNVKLEEDEATSLGDINTLSLGFGLHQAWIYATMFGSYSVFGISFNTNESVSSPIFTISLITFAICLLLMGLLDQKLLKYLVDRRTMIAAAVVTCIGSLFILFCNDASIGLFFSFVAGISTGIGSAILICFWGTAFARNSIPTIAINTAVGIVVAVVVYAILLYLIPKPASGIMAALLPPASVFFLWQHTPIAYTKRRELPLFRPLPVRRGAFFFRIAVPMTIFGFVLGYMRGNITGTILPESEPVGQMVTLVIAGLLVLAGFLVAIVFTPDEDPNALCRALLAPIGLAIITLPFADMGQPWAMVVLLAGYMMFEALMWTYMGSLSQAYAMSPIAVFGISRGMLAVGTLAGAFSGIGLSALLIRLSGGGATLLSVLILGLLLAFCTLPTFRTIQRMVKPGNPDRTMVDVINESHEPADHPEERQDSVPEAFVTRDGFKGGRFRRCCEMVASRYLLSRRESEVLFFLAKGHNAAYIQEKLFISEGTAKTHIRHIYKKTNVHNQQELMRTVEAMEEELTASTTGDSTGKGSLS